MDISSWITKVEILTGQIEEENGQMVQSVLTAKATPIGTRQKGHVIAKL